MSYDKDTKEWSEDSLYVERKLGRIDIAEHFYKHDQQTLLKLFGLLMPVEVSYEYSTQTFRIKAYAKQFEPVPLGETIPYYQVIIHKNNPKLQNDIEIEFKKA